MYNFLNSLPLRIYSEANIQMFWPEWKLQELMKQKMWLVYTTKKKEQDLN